MINFTLDKIQLRNVRCYGDEMMEMDFPVNNLTVFTGPVGAGKSTILKSVSMALYGEDGGAKGEKLTIDDMINEKTNKNLEIHLFFHSTVDDKPEVTNYEIHLFHKHSKYNNKLVFVKNGKDISLESKTATYELIEKTLIPKNVYHNIYYFTQQAKNFFTALPNNEQKEIFNSILDLSEYKDYYSNTKNCLSESELKIASCTSTVQSIKETLNSLHKMYDDTVINIQKEREELKNKIDNLSNEIEKCILDKGDLEYYKQELQDSINELDAKIIEHSKLCTQYENEIDKLKTKHEDLVGHYNNVIVEGLKQKFVKIKDDKVKEIEDEITKIKFKINDIKSNINDIIKEYEIEKHNIKDDINKKYSKDIDVLKQRQITISEDILKSKQKCVDELNKLKDNIQDNISKIKDIITGLNIELSSYELKININNKELTDIDVNINKYRNKLNEPDAICEMCGQKLADKEHIHKHIENLEKRKNELVNSNNVEIENKKICEAKLLENMSIVQNYKNQFESEKTLKSQSYQEDKQRLETERDEVVKNINDLENKISNEISNIINNRSNEVETIINKKKYEVSGLESESSKLQNQINDIVNELRSQYKIELSELQKENDLKLSKIIGSINEYTSKMHVENKITTESFEVIQEQKNRLNQLVKDINNKIISINEKSNLIQQYNDTINKNVVDNKSVIEISENINKYESILKEKQSILDKLNHEETVLNFWKQAFSDSGIKSMLIDSAIPHMNECVANELDKVAPGVFTVSFDTLSETKSGKIKDKFSINILNNVKGSTGHKKLSGGEKRIIDLCCMSALRSLAEKLYNKRFHHIFYDEILDSLDVEFKEMFCNNVKRQSETGCNISLVTHDLPEDVDPDRVFPF